LAGIEGHVQTLRQTRELLLARLSAIDEEIALLEQHIPPKKTSGG